MMWYAKNQTRDPSDDEGGFHGLGSNIFITKPNQKAFEILQIEINVEIAF